jgi:hypothetical protein
MLMSVGPVTGLQLTSPLAPPQHSAELVQRLFRILQPSPGWQTLTPVWAHGPQILLQQLPHPPLHTTPSCWQEPVPVVVGFWQVPTVAPDARWHQPLQQSVSREQTSPGWMHQEAPSAHFPPLQRPEQQVVVPASVVPHGLPAVAQVVLSGLQVLPLQLPLQQAAELVHAWLSATQLEAVEQTPRAVSHWRLQQSVGTAHELPGPLQVATDDAHFIVAGSHDCEQHWPFVVQAAPATVQMTPAPPDAELPAAPAEPTVPPEALAPLAPPAAVPAVPPWAPPAPAPAWPELFPQPGITRSAATSRAAIAAIDTEVAEGLGRPAAAEPTSRIEG